MAAVDGAGTQAQYFTDLRFAVLKEIIEQNDVPLLRRQPQDGLGQHGVVDLNRPAVDVQRAAGTVFLFAGIRFSGYVEPFQRDLPCLTSCQFPVYLPALVADDRFTKCVKGLLNGVIIYAIKR